MNDRDEADRALGAAVREALMAHGDCDAAMCEWLAERMSEGGFDVESATFAAIAEAMWKEQER